MSKAYFVSIQQTSFDGCIEFPCNFLFDNYHSAKKKVEEIFFTYLKDNGIDYNFDSAFFFDEYIKEMASVLNYLTSTTQEKSIGEWEIFAHSKGYSKTGWENETVIDIINNVDVSSCRISLSIAEVENLEKVYVVSYGGNGVGSTYSVNDNSLEEKLSYPLNKEEAIEIWQKIYRETKYYFGINVDDNGIILSPASYSEDSYVNLEEFDFSFENDEGYVSFLVEKVSLID